MHQHRRSVEGRQAGNIRRFHRNRRRHDAFGLFRMQRQRNERLGQPVAEQHGARRKFREARQRWVRTLKGNDDFAYRSSGVHHHGHAVLADGPLGGQRTLHETFHRRGHVGEGGDFRHREGTIHGVDGAHQLVCDQLRAAGAAGINPGVHGFEMTGNLGLEDFKQHRVDREAVACGRFCELGLLGEQHLGFGIDDGGVDHPRCFSHNLGDRHRELRGLVEHFFARRHAVGQLLDPVEVGVHRLALQRGTQQRQGVECVLDQRNHRGTGGASAVQHSVQRALDLPAELAQRLGAHQATTALERVEHAADGPQLLHVVRMLAPRGQQVFQAADLFLEFLQEHFANLVVDFVAGAVEAGDDRPARDRRLAVRRGCRGG